VIPNHGPFTLAHLVVIFQVNVLGRHEPFTYIDRLSSYTGFSECTPTHFVHSLAAEIDKYGCDATALVVWVAEAEVEDW
jgi:hypothetical protein